MPELPEVESYTRYFARHALHQRITRVQVLDERILGEIRAETFARRLKGREFTRARRHGKHLFADAGGVWLHLHFGMTGDLAYYRDDAERPRFARVVFVFENGAKLAYDDMRLFGLVDVIGDPDRYIEGCGLGLDPLDPQFTFRAFDELLDGRDGAIKSFLMTQERIAGLGNLYVDEILFQTGIHPRRKIGELAPKERKAIHAAMRKILRETIAREERGLDRPARWLIHHREEGGPCPKCGGEIARTVVFGRTTYFCRTHQK